MDTVLDLSRKKRDHLVLTLEDDEVIKIKRPSQVLLNYVIDYFKAYETYLEKVKSIDFEGDVDQDATLSDAEAQIDRMYDAVAQILSNNTENKEFSADELKEKLIVDDAHEIMFAYQAFINGLSAGMEKK